MKKRRIRKSTKRIISLVLLITILLSIIPLTALAEWADMPKKSKDSIALKASTKEDEVITVKNGGSTIEENDLSLTFTKQKIERDYDQKYVFTVKNTSDKMRRLYFELDNSYDDLSMEIVGPGSKDNLLLLNTNEQTSVEIVVFAQNAELPTHTIPVSAYELVGSDSTLVAKGNALIVCSIPDLNLDWKEVSTNSSTLGKTIKITNKGNTLTDVTVFARGDLANYVSFNPGVSNYQMAEDESLVFTVAPDLAKMKDDNISTITGEIIAKTGFNSSVYPCTFDTKGEPISTISMIELANKQNGNPLTKFEPIEDTISVEAFDGEKYTNKGFSNESEILDNEGYFSAKVKSDVDLGLERPITFSETITSKRADETSEIPTEPTITLLDNGNIQITSIIRMSGEEYKYFVSDSIQETPKRKGLFIAKAEDSYEYEAFKKDVDVYLHYELPFDELKELVEPLGYYFDAKIGIDAGVEDGFGGFGFCLVAISDGVESFNNGADAIDVCNDPSIDENTKCAYVGLTVAQEIIRWGANFYGIASDPVSAIVVNFIGNLFIKGLDLIKKDLIHGTNYTSALMQAINGKQCMNRGKTDISFYAPKMTDNTSNKMYVSSNMYRPNDTYVNQEEVNYNYSLNGKSAGKSHNAGLTDYNISEIPTEHLIYGGTNTLSSDYDVMPGHYWLNADTTVTLLPKEDVKLGYIGDYKDLPDVRCLPDFIVNTENIYADDAIIGEPTNIYIKVYNIGGHSGWFSLKASIDGKEIKIANNQYIDAFSNKVINIPITLNKANSDLSINVINETVYLNERSNENNNVTKIISARERQIPVVGEFVSSNNYTGIDNLYRLSISKIRDINSVNFELDGLSISDDYVTTSVWEDMMKCCVSLPEDIEAGNHTLMAKVNYQTAEGNNTIDKSITFGINSSTLTFNQDTDYTSPTYYYISQEDSGVYRDVNRNSDGSYSLQADAFMANNLNDVTIVVVHDKGIAYAPVKGWDGTIIKNNPAKVKVQTPNGYNLNSVTVTYLNDMYLGQSLNGGTTEYELSPGVYDFTIELESDESGLYYYINKEVTIPDGSTTIDLSEAIKDIKVSIKNAKADNYDVVLLTKQNDVNYWNTYYLDSLYKAESETLMIGLDESEKAAIEKADQYQLLIYSNSEVYTLGSDEIKKQPVQLNSTDLNKVTFKHGNDLSINNAKVSVNDYSCNLNSDTVYLSDGAYQFVFDCRTENQGVTVKKDVSINKDTEIPVSIDYSAMNKLNVKYDKKYTGMSSMTVDGSSYSDLKNGSPVYYNESGIVKGSAKLEQDKTYFEISQYFDSEKKEQDWNIDSEFEGSMYLSNTTVDSGESFVVYLNYLEDKYDNSLEYVMADKDSPLMGYAVFTDTKTKKKEYVKISATDMRTTIIAPEAEGEYTLEVNLFTNSTYDDSEEPKPDDPTPSDPDDPTPSDPDKPTPVTPDSKFTGLANEADKNGVWWYYTNGKIDKNHTGVDQNRNGWWRVENGKVNFKAQGIYQNKYGWWKTTDGEVTFKENSIYQNEHGWWKCKDSKVDFTAQSIYQNKYGWWKTTDGEVTFKENGVYQNENGWWKCNDSKVNFKFTGIARNKYGVWFIRNGKVDFNKTGKVKIRKRTGTTKNGKPKYTYKYYTVKNGKVA